MPEIGTIRVGRAEDNDVIMDDSSVSLHHCLFRGGEAGAEVEDAGTDGGTEVNGCPLSGQIMDLRHGDVVRIGNLEFAVEAPEWERGHFSGGANIPGMAPIAIGHTCPRCGALVSPGLNFCNQP